MLTSSSSSCRLCGHPITTQALSLRALPVCNRFTRDGQVERPITLDIVECDTCRLVQLNEVPPPDALVPTVPWIRYREPEGHLDAAVEELLSLRPQASSVLGTGPFESPLLGRL